MSKFFNKNLAIYLNNNIVVISIFAVLIILNQIAIFFITDGNPVFTTNDSYGYYLTEAKNIYRQSSIHDISKLALNLYFDQVKLSGYNFEQIKPYHFPVYSIYLSLFFYLFDNEFLIIAFSQFLPCLVMLYFSYLIIRNYHNTSQSLVLCILGFLCSPLTIFVCDTTAEVFTGALIILSFYLGFFAKKREGWLYYFGFFVVISLEVLRIKYLILLPILILIYRLIPSKYTEETPRIDKKNLIIFLILLIFLPGIIRFYCYNYLNWHSYNIEISLLKKDGDVIERLLYSWLNNFVLIFSYHIIYTYHNLLLLFIFLFGAKYYLKSVYKIFLLKKISRIDVVYFFYFLYFVTIAQFYIFDGYRMLAGGAIFVLALFYNNYKSLPHYKSFDFKNLRLELLILLIIFFILNLSYQMVRDIASHQAQMRDRTLIIKDFAKKNNVNKIAIQSDSIDKVFRLPFVHLFDKEVYVYQNWMLRNYCDDFAKYNQDGFRFELLVFLKEDKINCEIIDKYYVLHEVEDFKFYLKKPN